jgi:uncharacterized membrane protein YphA (DoxX/SURF4 family)
MLNPFPDLLFLSLLAPFLIRITVGALFIWVGYSYLFREREAVAVALERRWPRRAMLFILFGGIFDVIAGIFLVAGFLTQIAAIAGMLIAIDALFVKWLYKDLDGVAKYSRPFYILIFIVSLSLLLSGAGAFAVDLPL